MTPEQKLKQLENAYVENTQSLQWLLANLDEKNVMRAKAVIADWVYAGNIKATQIDVSEAKIQVAQIEELEVGKNVTMGADATISWSQVSDTPTIPTLPGYITSTKITSTTIESPTITGGSITGVTLTAQDYLYIDTSNINEGLYLNGTGGIQMYMRVWDPAGTIELGPYVRITSGLSVGGSAVSLNGHTHSGYALTNHSHPEYVNASGQSIAIQYFSDHIEVNGGGGWKVIYFA
jgi:hypothetical protein